ncbi:MAG: carbohydrate ABC transporter permease [Hungatella sp.]
MNLGMHHKNIFFECVVSLLVLLCAAICLFPILHILAMSLSSKNAILSGHVSILPVGFNIDAYKKVLADPSFLYSFGYSIALTLLFTFFAMTATILAAYPLSKSDLKGKGIIMTLIVLTMYLDPGLIPNYLNIKNLGLMNTVWALIFPGILSAYNLIILKTFFTGIDKSLFESAYIDGCTEWKALIHIAIPLAKPSIATLSLFYGVSRWNGVSDVLYYISNSNLYTVQMKLKQMIDSIVLPPGETSEVVTLIAENVKSATIVFSMIPVLLFYPFVQRYFTKGIMLGAVKG